MIFEKYRIRSGWIAKKLVDFVDSFTPDVDEYGFAFWPFIFFDKKENMTKRAIKHEKKHIQQWVSYLIIGFLPAYMYYHFRYGYWDNPLEKEARLAEFQK